MNKKKLLQKADELIAKAFELKELANSNIILVPDNIKISESINLLSKGIVNGIHQLYLSTKDNYWLVSSHKLTLKIKCKLTPCKYEELKPGDIFYRDNNLYPEFKNLNSYAIKLETGYQFWRKKDCIFDNQKYNYYWKVEEV